MFGTIRRHQTWLWVVIIAVVIVSFVVFFSPDARLGGSGRGGAIKIDGINFTPQDLSQAYRETRLLYFLNFQRWPENDERARQMGFDLDNESYMRLLRIAKARKAKIAVSDLQVAQMAKRVLGQNASLDAFVKEILEPNNLSEADFESFLRHDLAFQQLGLVAGLTGTLVPPREIEANYREEHEELELQAVFFSVSNYLGGISVKDEDLLPWYTNNMALFREPEKLRLSYVAFDRSNFLAEADQRVAEVTNLNQVLEAIYARSEASSFTNETGAVLPKEAALQKIKQNERNKIALSLAARRANEFANRFYDEKSHKLEDFEKFAAAEKLTVRVTGPFSEAEVPPEFKGVSEQFVSAAFTLTNRDEAVLFQPAVGDEAVYVAALKERIASFNPPFEKVRNQVVEQYKRSEAMKLARLSGMNFHNRLTNSLAQGKDFATVAAESNLKPTLLPPISRATRTAPGLPETVYLQQLKNVAFNLKVGGTSYYVPTIDGGFILHLKGKYPFDEAKMKRELAEYGTAMRAQRQNEALGMWFRKEAERANLPLNRGQGAGDRGPS